MELKGKYRVEIREANSELVRTIETPNLIVNAGLNRVVDWLRHDIYSDNFFPGLKELDTTGMTVTTAGFTNPNNAVDGSDSTYTQATIDSSSWDNDWWKIDFGENKDLLAIYIDWEEDDVNYGADYKFQYSTDNSTWTDFGVRLRPPQESNVRGKVLFYVNISPPFTKQTLRYFRLNTKRGNDNETFNLYQIKFYEDNFLPQAPLVMGLGIGTTSPDESDTGLESVSITKKVESTIEHASYIVRYIMALDGTEGNNTTFTEAGMFFNDTDHYSLQTPTNATTLFSRALFDTSWSKTAGQTADIYYELSISNTSYVSSSSSTSSSSISSSSSNSA